MLISLPFMNYWAWESAHTWLVLNLVPLVWNPNNSIPIMINKEMVLRVACVRGRTGYQNIAARKRLKTDDDSGKSIGSFLILQKGTKKCGIRTFRGRWRPLFWLATTITLLTSSSTWRFQYQNNDKCKMWNKS